MTNPPDSNSTNETTDEAGVRPEPASAPKTPRWVKVFAIIAAVAIVVIVVVLVVDGGKHGPGRHMPGRHNPSMQHR